MFNFYDLNIIPIILNRLDVKKVLLIGLSDESILNKLITHCINNNGKLYTIDNKINIDDLIKENPLNDKDNLTNNIKHFKGLSLNILNYLKDFDAVFINDDPNWYTIFNELNLIKKNSSKFPLVFICNNKYPHKRRDSYINPNNIPQEYKHECCNELPIKYEENNMIKHAMIDDGFCHAIYKETPKNGVLTAIEDFLKENNYLNFLEINFLEGIALIYNDSTETKNIINKILDEEKEFEYDNIELSDKIIENNFLLKQLSKMNLNANDLEGMKLEIEKKDKEIGDYKDKIDSQNKQINTIKNQMNLKDTQLQNIKSELNITKYKQEPNDFINMKNEIIEKENKINLLKQETTNQLSKIEQKEYCINCFKDEISNKQFEINYLKKSTLIKKILNPISYIYLLLKSNPKEIFLNFKLYKSLKNSSCFDIGFYLNNNEDLVESKWCKYFSPELHYVCKGFNENRLFNKKYFNRDSKKELLNYLLECNK